MHIINSSLVALVATLFCIWLLKPLAIRIGLVDRPGGRKLHGNDVPLIGGIAMFFGFCFALLSLQMSLENYRGMIAGSALLVLMGVVDDFKELSSKLRLFGQLLASLLLVIWGQHVIENLGDLFFMGPFSLGAWGLPVTVFAVIGYINAMNMVDGQDGLAGGIALGQVVLLGMLCMQLGLSHDFQLLTIMAVLLLVFLCFNMPFPWRRQASIFMGDSGITFVAFLLAWFSVEISQANIEIVRPVTILWILAFPLFDLISVSIHRIQKGKSPFVASRDHFHHVLHLSGIDTTISTLLLWVISWSLGLIGFVLNYYKVVDAWQLLGLLAALVIYFFLVKIVRDPKPKNE